MKAIISNAQCSLLYVAQMRIESNGMSKHRWMQPINPVAHKKCIVRITIHFPLFFVCMKKETRLKCWKHSLKSSNFNPIIQSFVQLWKYSRNQKCALANNENLWKRKRAELQMMMTMAYDCIFRVNFYKPIFYFIFFEFQICRPFYKTTVLYKIYMRCIPVQAVLY